MSTPEVTDENKKNKVVNKSIERKLNYCDLPVNIFCPFCLQRLSIKENSFPVEVEWHRAACSNHIPMSEAGISKKCATQVHLRLSLGSLHGY